MLKLKYRYIQASNMVHSIWMHHAKKTNIVQQEKNILIPFFGMIGDAVLFLDALEGYCELYPQECHYLSGYRCDGLQSYP